MTLYYSVHFVTDVFAEDLNELVIYVGINMILYDGISVYLIIWFLETLNTLEITLKDHYIL